MTAKPEFKAILNQEKDKPENFQSFQNLLIQEILVQLKDSDLLDAEIFSEVMNLLWTDK